jgi:hypothetical protein
MGIRFLCPNGHQLNVKSFQAGKRGICPHCGARFTIPNESTLTGSEKTDPPNAADGVDKEIVQEQAVEQGGVQDPQEVADRGAERLDQQVTPPATPTKAVDPLAEAPGAKWYVSPPGGGQFGPAGGDLMRTWIAEGRVTADSLVWREGWDDWAEASTVLPDVVPPETAAYLPPSTPAETLPIPTITISEPMRTTGRGVKHARGQAGRRRPLADKTLLWVGILGALVVVLVILFIWILNRS